MSVRRHSKKIEDENYFNSQTNLKEGCGSTLPHERSLGLWITENRESDKKVLVPEPQSEFKIVLTFVHGIVLSQSYLAAPAEDFGNPPSACCETHLWVRGWFLPEHRGNTYSGWHLTGVCGLSQENGAYWNYNLSLFFSFFFLLKWS